MHCKLPRHPVQNLFPRLVHHRRSSTNKSFLAIISPSLRPHRIGKEFALANRIVHLLKNKIMKKILVGIWDFLSMVHKFSLIFFVKVDFFLGNHLAFTAPALNSLLGPIALFICWKTKLWKTILVGIGIFELWFTNLVWFFFFAKLFL